MARGSPLLAILALALLAPLAPAGADAPYDPEAALAWLASNQRPEFAAYVVEALAAAGKDPRAWPDPNAPVWSALAPYGRSQQEREYSYLRVAYAAGAAGYDPRDVNGVDLVAEVLGTYRDGQFGQTAYVNDDAWAILALRAAGVDPADARVQAARAAILDGRAADGGWAHTRAAPIGDTDVTGMALAALRAAGHDTTSDLRARLFLDGTRRDGGGHAGAPGLGRAANCQSTVWALHGYAALGDAWRDDTLAWLRALQNADGGFRLSSEAGPSNLFCTTEAATLLAGGTHPLASFRPLALPNPVAHALEPVTLGLGPPYERARWEFADGEAAGLRVTRTFAHAGAHAYRVHAEGPGVRSRVDGQLDVQSARPLLGALPANATLQRGSPLALDLGSATDPDGRVLGARIEWGDGNATRGPALRAQHAYERPGEYVVRARVVDDAGVESHPARVLVSVENRAPVLVGLPERLVADRVAGVALRVQAEDPDGDAVVVRWSAGALAGEGDARFVPDALGNLTLEVEAADAWGGLARGSVLVETRNAPPAIVLREPIVGEGVVELAADASDADGPPPRVVWEVGAERHEGARVRLPLAPGAHAARAVATDAEGAQTAASTTIVVPEKDAPARAAPEIRAWDARLEEDALVVTFETTPGARVSLSWTSDVGDGVLPDPANPARIPLAGVGWALARLELEADGLVASRESALLVAPPRPPAAPPTAPPPEAPEPVELVAAAPAALSPAAEAQLAPAGLRLEAPAPQETPAPAGALVAALLLASAARRRRAR